MAILSSPGARYEVEVDPAGKASDLTRVTRKATLNGGSVALVGNAGSYALRSTYTILTADQGLSGTFEGVASRYAFLDPTLSYDANNAYLNLTRNDVSLVDAARTRNQAAVARAIERIGVNAVNPVYDAVVQLPTAVAARGAFDQLSGEILASARTALIEDSRHVREAVTDRLRAAWGGAGVSTESMTLHGRQAEATQEGPDGKAVWSRGFGAWGRTGSDGNAARLNHSTGGFLLGTDARLSQHWRAGARLQPDPLRCRQCLGIQRQLPSGAVWRRAMGPAGPAPGRGSHLACAARVASGGVRRVRGRAEVGLSRARPRSSATWAIASTRRWGPSSLSSARPM